MNRKKTSWNRLPALTPEASWRVASRHALLPNNLPKPFTPFGNGRSYGDVCLTDRGSLILTESLDHFIEFNPEAGLLCCEAGVRLSDVIDLIIPYGWLLPSLPGTSFATVGGAVANDVHGKNHHFMGTFCHHVTNLELLRSDGNVINCGPQENSEWFHATVGGLGLTGLIRRVELQLMPIKGPWMDVMSESFACLDDFWEVNSVSESTSPYVVSWVDCLSKGRGRGRGVTFKADHASMVGKLGKSHKRFFNVPIEFPVSPINKFSLKFFNKMYYSRHRGFSRYYQNIYSYFFPLDRIRNWNRVYGSRGFYQYQCVLPPNNSEEATAELLNIISSKEQGSFLAVLKTFGNRRSLGMLSFARPGTTLALDFPNTGSDVLKLLKSLDAVVQEAGGALYPAKDARMPASLFRLSFPLWESFSKFVDPNFSSAFWRRVT